MTNTQNIANITTAITPTTKTDDLLSFAVTEVQRGARTLLLGRFTARWKDNAWHVHDGCETRLVLGGLVVGVPTIVRCWMADDWNINSPDGAERTTA